MKQVIIKTILTPKTVHILNLFVTLAGYHYSELFN